MDTKDFFPTIPHTHEMNWDFDRPSDFDNWNVFGFAVNNDNFHAGRLELGLTATDDLEGYAFYRSPFVQLGLGMNVKLLFVLNVSEVVDCDLAFGLTGETTGWLGAGNALRDGVVLQSDYLDSKLDLVIASGNTTAGYTDTVTAQTKEWVRSIGAGGWAVWALEIHMSDTVLGKGTVQVYVNNVLIHTEESLRLPYQTVLTPAVAMINRTAVERTFSLDKVWCKCNRFTSSTIEVTVSNGDGGGGNGNEHGGDVIGGVGCIAHGQTLDTPDGPLAAELVTVGTLLLTPDGPKPVTACKCVGEKPLLKVRSVTGETVLCTFDQPFMVDGEQVEAQELGIGAQLDTLNGLSAVMDVEPTGGQADCYAYTVEGGVFYAGGMLLHNKVWGGGASVGTLIYASGS